MRPLGHISKNVQIFLFSDSMEVFYRGECFFPLFVICSRLEKLVLAQKVMRGSMYVRGIHPIKRIQHFLRMLMNLIINRAWTSFHADCGEKKKKRGEVWFGGFNDEKKCLF